MKEKSGHKKEEINTSPKTTDRTSNSIEMDEAWNLDYQAKSVTDSGWQTDLKRYDQKNSKSDYSNGNLKKLNKVEGYSHRQWEEHESSSKSKFFISVLIIVGLIAALAVTYFIVEINPKSNIITRDRDLYDKQDQYEAPNNIVSEPESESYSSITEMENKKYTLSPEEEEEISRRARKRQIAREDRYLQSKVERLASEYNYKNATVFYPSNFIQSIKDRIVEMEKERGKLYYSYEKDELRNNILDDMIVVVSEDGVDVKINFINDLRKLIGKGVYKDQEKKEKKDSITQSMINSAIFRNEALSRFSPSKMELLKSLRHYRQMFQNQDAFISWVNERYESDNNFKLLLKSRIAEEKYANYLKKKGMSLADELSRLESGLVISRPKKY